MSTKCWAAGSPNYQILFQEWLLKKGCHQEMTLLFSALSLMCMANLPYHHSYAGSPQQVWFYLNHSRSLQVHNRLPFTQFILEHKIYGNNICKTHFQRLLHLTGSVFQCSWTVCGWGTSEKILVDPWGELRSYRGYHCRFLTSSDEILVSSTSLLQSHDHLRWMK